MSLVLWTVGLSALVALQTTALPVLVPAVARPDLLLVAVVLLAIYRSGEGVLWVAAFLGYAKDLFSGGVLGVSFSLFFLTAYFIIDEKYRLDFDHYLPLVLIFMATALEGYGAFFFRQLGWKEAIVWWPVHLTVAAHALVNALLFGTTRSIWLWASELWQERQIASRHVFRGL